MRTLHVNNKANGQGVYHVCSAWWGHSERSGFLAYPKRGLQTGISK